MYRQIFARGGATEKISSELFCKRTRCGSRVNMGGGTYTQN
jgi:hypothetical protein